MPINRAPPVVAVMSRLKGTSASVSSAPGTRVKYAPHALLSRQQAGVDERLWSDTADWVNPEGFGEVAHACLAAFEGGDHGQQPQPGRVRNGLQGPSEIRCGGGQRLTRQRRPAPRQDYRRHQRSRLVLHPTPGSPWDAVQIASQT